MVDKPKLDQMLANLRQYVGALRELASVPQDEFLANRDKIGNAKYHFVIAIECCIDIANHVIASEGYRLPRDRYAGAFPILPPGLFMNATTARLRAQTTVRSRPS